MKVIRLSVKNSSFYFHQNCVDCRKLSLTSDSKQNKGKDLFLILDVFRRGTLVAFSSVKGGAKFVLV